MRRIRHAPWARARVDEADGWLARHAPDAPILVVAANGEAASSLLRREVAERGPAAARFGAHRTTLSRLATTVALPRLVADGRRPATGLARVALCARVLHELAGRGELGRYARVADRPGLPTALAATLHDLRMAAVEPEAVGSLAPDLSTIYRAYLTELATAGLADRADVFAAATAVARDLATGAPLGRPTLLLDVAVGTRLEERLVAALADRAPDLLALTPSGDAPTLAHLTAALGVPGEPLRLRSSARRHRSAETIPAPLARLQEALFDDTELPPAALDDPCVSLLSAPGESRECVEIARRARAEADRGVPFDRMAILLRSPEAYRAPLAEALRRADIPSWLAPGTVAPDPAGRALLALLACAAEGLTSRRFAEYLSLGEAPPVAGDDDGAPIPSFALAETTAAPEPWAPPLDPDASAVIARLSAEHQAPDPLAAPPVLTGPVVDGRLRAPRRWEQLLDDAAVIGGLDRWSERLDHFAAELRLDRAAAEDPDGPRAYALDEDLRLVSGLRRFALPLLGALAELPRSADWATWLAALRDLATRALRAPDRVLGLLSDLAPMGPVGPVGLDEVRLVLTRHLSELSAAPSGRPAGRVWVGSVDDARGRDFDVVFVPGLHEKSFPQRLIEDPLLLDRVRVALRAATGARLDLNADRAAAERLRLRLAIGATSERLVISWSRLDVDKGRPRVPSFYGLEVLRAAEGRLPGFDELALRAERGEARRLGWPAPDDSGARDRRRRVRSRGPPWPHHRPHRRRPWGGRRARELPRLGQPPPRPRPARPRPPRAAPLDPGRWAPPRSEGAPRRRHPRGSRSARPRPPRLLGDRAPEVGRLPLPIRPLRPPQARPARGPRARRAPRSAPARLALPRGPVRAAPAPPRRGPPAPRRRRGRRRGSRAGALAARRRARRGWSALRRRARPGHRARVGGRPRRYPG